ncbi:oxygen-binding di-iron domain-containing protein [Anaeromicropila herbilytica]|uniref:ODP domain-containing protein n=1 Tax=Anaeromicropila herbilytica TaxID=2785025 RepID=A0A7R7IDV6_9FIRM|nr:MBL fold metallo-hydrolase [Anaeromicropila herbilytica]BCN31957.1 hypothetical protein bsdtb5_32520 [Anaeromicropila herbilytica]
MTKIYTDLYQFTQVIEPIKLSIHQYLLVGKEPILIQTGAMPQTEVTLPQIKEILGEMQLKYILVSHFESDECGGLSVVLKEYPNAITVCSEVTARQLMGFGITNQVEIKKPTDTLSGNDFEFGIIGYPSEMHLWEGLLFIEMKRGIFFSSDLMFAMGENHGKIIEKTWDEAIGFSGVENIPMGDMLDKMMRDLRALSPRFVACGHGPCVKVL